VRVRLLGDHKEVQGEQEEKDRRFFHSFPLFLSTTENVARIAVIY
jgi:hypothetical protein